MRIYFHGRPIYEQAITEILSKVTFMSVNDFGTDLLILLHDHPVVFGIKLRRECRGPHEITEHHRQLAPLCDGV